jgi:pimeloyl-ACP methyl ester carboxylesterase
VKTTSTSRLHKPTAADMRACLTQPRRTVVTRAGVIEYAERGEGPPLLSVHGTPGGCDQGLLMAELFRANGFRVIAPSRPGYLGTPLATGRSCREQADALAALLDALALDRVAVLGVSGGGPSSYLLAAECPDRVSCLLEVDSLCLPVTPSRLERIAWSRIGVWLMLAALNHFPGPLVRMFFGEPTKSRDVRRLSEQIELMRALTLSGAGPERRLGYRNDDAQFAALPRLSLTAITAPTLIIHGAADQSVPPVHADHAHSEIQGSVLHWIAGGGHAGFLADDDAQHRAVQWLTSHATRRSP